MSSLMPATKTTDRQFKPSRPRFLLIKQINDRKFQGLRYRSLSCPISPLKRQNPKWNAQIIIHSFPRTHHLAMSSSLFRSIIRLQHSRLTLICLRESVAALFAHALYLSDLADGFLELFHSTRLLLASYPSKQQRKGTYLGR